uniref:Uncharacterized protein n=1 Tax=Arion vulgaris TaxID=1028688 RepID=A0A0B7AXW4_9EUPU
MTPYNEECNSGFWKGCLQEECWAKCHRKKTERGSPLTLTFKTHCIAWLTI